MLFPPTFILEIWKKCLELSSPEDKFAAYGYRDLSWSEKVERRSAAFAQTNSNLVNLRRIEDEPFERVSFIMNEIADELKQPPPALYVYDDRTPLSLGVAFAQNYSIGIHKAACEELSDEAMKELLAHEFSHFFDRRLESILIKSALKMRDRDDNSPAEHVLWNVAFMASELLFYRRLRANENDADGLATYFTKENKGKGIDEIRELSDREYQKQQEKKTQPEEKTVAKSNSIRNIPFLLRFSVVHPEHKDRLKDMEKGTYIERSMKRFEEEANDRTK